MRALFASWVVVALAACTSNPTPHPGQPDALRDTYVSPDTGRTNSDKGPDLDDDGVPDCEQYGGYWEQGDSVCVGGTPTGVVDADVVDGDAPDGDVAGDADEGDVSDDGAGAGPDAEVGGR